MTTHIRGWYKPVSNARVLQDYGPLFLTEIESYQGMDK